MSKRPLAGYSCADCCCSSRPVHEDVKFALWLRSCFDASSKKTKSIRRALEIPAAAWRSFTMDEDFLRQETEAKTVNGWIALLIVGTLLAFGGDVDKIAEILRQSIQKHIDVAGIEVDQAKIAHLAYAPEIAQATLRRQQAEAVIAARRKLVEGAVSIVEM